MRQRHFNRRVKRRRLDRGWPPDLWERDDDWYDHSQDWYEWWFEDWYAEMYEWYLEMSAMSDWYEWPWSWDGTLAQLNASEGDVFHLVPQHELDDWRERS